MFFGKDRVFFLEFLRNLTPQGIFLAAALVFQNRINTSVFQPDWDGLTNVLPTILSWSIFVGSLCANSSQFFDNVLKAPDELKIEMKRIKARNLKIGPSLWNVLRANWMLNKSSLLKFSVVYLVTVGSLTTIAFMAGNSALTALKLTH